MLIFSTMLMSGCGLSWHLVLVSPGLVMGEFLRGAPLSMMLCICHGVGICLLKREVSFGPDGLLDAYIALIPKTDGDATPLGQRPLSVLPIVYCVWASARMVQLEDWFRSWVPDSFYSAGGCRSSIEAWYTAALLVPSCLEGAEGFACLLV